MNDTKITMTQAQQFQVMKLIEANGNMEGEYFAYNAGWDDERVAKETGTTAIGVANRRKNVFGKLRKGRSSDLDEVEARVESMDIAQKAARVVQFEHAKRLEALERALNILLSAPNRDSIPKDKLEDLRRHFNGQVKVAVPT